jgi:tetratricopeptide (TPR) repeat protein
VFDQFEEIFTLGNAPALRAKRLPFLPELADLIENRPPASLERKLEDEPERIDTILFAKQDYRVLLSLREDYLPQLEGLKPLAPSIMENRQRLRQMTGTQALEVLLKPGAGLVSPEVARQIVGFVAKAGGTGKTLAVDELAELEVPPSILSLFARQLNDRLRQRGLAEITPALLSESAEGILEGFYEECLADQPPGVRAFVEEDLLTESGFRENMALEQARKKLQDRGGAATALDELVQRRLLQVEERFGVRRIELTHDVLTEAIAKSRTERRQKEALTAAAEREAALRESLRRQRRRMLAGALAALAVFAMVATLAIYGWVQQREAARQRDRAVQQKALALEAVSKLTYDLPDRLQRVPGVLAIVKNVYEDNLKLLDRVLELEGDSPDALREKHANYNRMGQTWERLGDSAKAREAYDKARSIIERLAADEPGNSLWQDDLAVSHVNIGDMLATQGNQVKALEEYREALNIRKRLAAEELDNAKWQRKLAAVHSEVATQLMAQGDLAAARKEQQNALEIAQRLAAKDPDNTDWQAFLASSHAQLAQVTLLQGDVAGAIREQRAALEVFERLAAKEPGDTNWQGQLANSHFGLGNVYTMKGDPENAAKENRIAGEIYERLAGQDPDNALWQKLLAMSHFATGNALMENDATRAIQEVRSALALYERLVAKDPGNAELQNWLVACHVAIANDLFAQKQFPEALTEARAALAAAERMGAQDPKNIIMVQNPLAWAHLLIGAILKEQGDHIQAMKELMTGLEIYRHLSDQDPSNAMFQFQVVNGGTMLAYVLHAQKKYDEALQAFASARDILEQLIARSPDNRMYQSTLLENYKSTTWPFLLTQRPNEAIGAASKGLEIDPTSSFLKINLAHAYLLTSQFEKAKTNLSRKQDVKLPDGRGFAQVVLKDFKDLREAGVTHPDIKRIERLLSGEASPNQLRVRRARGQSKN